MIEQTHQISCRNDINAGCQCGFCATGGWTNQMLFATSNPKPIGESKCAPSFGTSAGAKFTAMRFGGKAIRNMHLNIYQNRVNAAKSNRLYQCMHLILPKDNPKIG